MDSFARNAMQITLPPELPPAAQFVPGIRRAPDRGYDLSAEDTIVAVKNALRYVPPELHEALAPEFLEELKTRGRIYAYRYRPEGNLKAKPVDEYKGILESRCLQLNIDNNLDFDIALYPYELVTYGETGQVFQNWLQYRLVKRYLEEMREDQTLVIASGHPVGLFASRREAPRVINTNGLTVGEYDNAKDFHWAAQMGVANYGQMTAGGWIYIGPQGIVHGTYITLLSAGRLYLGLPESASLAGKLYLSSGLGGMSGAQPKAADIAGAVSVTAEVDHSRIQTRLEQGWVQRASGDLAEVFDWVAAAKREGRAESIAYHGNVVDLWQYVVDQEIPVELASDQTSCHAAYDGGYVPAGYSFAEARRLLAGNPQAYAGEVDRSLRRHFELIRVMTEERGTHFWDYGNAFLKAVFDAGVTEVARNGVDSRGGFIYPSYVESLMGPICFDKGFGPFRWVCASGDPGDLDRTDAAAMGLIDPERGGQDRDNYVWIRDAKKNRLVVGSQARILYSDGGGRVRMALKFNQMVRDGEVGPIVLGRDHHDVSGTDSPYRETANIYDGSRIMAEMAFHCWAGNAARGMTMVVASNGGGVGIGKAINTGYALVLDGSPRVDEIIRSAVEWDVMGGIARRSWGRNQPAMDTARDWNRENPDRGQITLPYVPEHGVVERLVGLD